jgi:hypothetical protein
MSYITVWCGLDAQNFTKQEKKLKKLYINTFIMGWDKYSHMDNINIKYAK